MATSIHQTSDQTDAKDPAMDTSLLVCAEEQKLADKRLDGEAKLYVKYREHGTVEDDHLVQKYSDDITGLLTFAGLLSAVITAFLFAEEVDFKLQSTATTNVLLYQILLQGRSPAQPDSVPLILPTDGFNTKAEDLETPSVILFYISLGLSLLSAFGGLASKQWIMHYGYTPPWANNDEKRARLRRMRHHGLKPWGFFVIMEAIPLLLQLSLLVFAIGVFLAARQGGLVQVLAGLSVIIGGLFYIVTLGLGALVPSAPFKSSLSQALFRLFFCATNAHLFAYSFGCRILSVLPFRRHHLLHAQWQLLERWSEYRKLRGEDSCLINEEIGAGIRWWGLSHGIEWDEKPVLAKEHSDLVNLKGKRKHRALAKNVSEEENEEHERLDRERAKTFERLVSNDPRLLEWGYQVIQKAALAKTLPLGTFSENNLKAQVDILCELIYYVPVATEFLLDENLCRAIGWAYGIKDAGHWDEMSATTATVYFRGLLHAGIRDKKIRSPASPTKPSNVQKPRNEVIDMAENGVDLHNLWVHKTARDTLCKEIQKILDHHQFKDGAKHKLLHQVVEDITSMIVLASILLSGKDDAERRAQLVQCTPYKQLHYSWELLSKIKANQLHDNEPFRDLMLACISTSAAILCNSSVQARFLEYAGLENKHFQSCLSILAELSRLVNDEDPNASHPFRKGVADFIHLLHEFEHRFSTSLKSHLSSLREHLHIKAHITPPDAASKADDSGQDKRAIVSSGAGEDASAQLRGQITQQKGDTKRSRGHDIEQGGRSQTT